MPYTIRDIITEACIRVNLGSRKQGIRGDIVENAFRHLKGIVAKYNSDNLLSFTQNSFIIPNKSLIHIYDQTDMVKGEYNYYFDTADEIGLNPPNEDDVAHGALAMTYETPNTCWSAGVIHYEDWDEYRWFGYRIREPYSQRMQQMKEYMSMYHFEAKDVSKINSIYLISGVNQEYKEFYKLDFVNHTDFNRYSELSRTFTYTQKSEGEWVIQIKPVIAKHKECRLKINYNEGVNFDLDSDMLIPDNYIELLIVALAHKLAIQYPRLDDAQMARLEKEVQVMVDNVRTPKAVDRMIMREPYFDKLNTNMTQSQLAAGDFLFR